MQYDLYLCLANTYLTSDCANLLCVKISAYKYLSPDGRFVLQKSRYGAGQFPGIHTADHPSAFNPLRQFLHKFQQHRGSDPLIGVMSGGIQHPPGAITDDQGALRTLIYAIVMAVLYMVSFVVQQRWVFTNRRKSDT